MSGTVSTSSAHAQLSRRLAVKRFLLFVLAALLCVSNSFAGPAKPKKHDLRREIFELEDAWRNAVLKSDTNALGALLADDYMAISATGMLQTKQEALASLRTHRVHIDTLLLSDRKVRFYGKTALVTSLAEIQGTTLDGAISGSYRYTRVYVLDAQGKWKIVNFESSKLRQPDDRHEHKKQEESPNAQ